MLTFWASHSECLPKGFIPDGKTWSSEPGERQMALPKTFAIRSIGVMESWSIGVLEYWKNQNLGPRWDLQIL